MNPLESPDIHYLSAASGWVGLSNADEARLELKKISRKFRSHPDVLEVRYELHALEKNWKEAIADARILTELEPEREFGWIHLAYALHEVKKTRQARDLLILVAERFPEDWLLRYNLACYECQLGDENSALDWLAQAFELGNPKQIKVMALHDKDLQPLWAKLAENAGQEG